MKLRSQLADMQEDSAPSDGEKYWIKHEAWNQPNITERVLVVNNEQMLRISNKEYETLVDVGNRLYPKRKSK